MTRNGIDRWIAGKTFNFTVARVDRVYVSLVTVNAIFQDGVTSLEGIRGCADYGNSLRIKEEIHKNTPNYSYSTLSGMKANYVKIKSRLSYNNEDW